MRCDQEMLIGTMRLRCEDRAGHTGMCGAVVWHDEGETRVTWNAHRIHDLTDPDVHQGTWPAG